MKHRAIVGTSALLLALSCRGGDQATEIPPPDHVVPDGLTPCPVHKDLERVADEHRRSAIAMRQRSAFDPLDGVRAVAEFGVASACYRRAGLLAQADAAEASARTLRANVERAYRGAVVELRLARASAEFGRALHAVRLLRRFLVDMPGTYSRSLEALEIELSATARLEAE